MAESKDGENDGILTGWCRRHKRHCKDINIITVPMEFSGEDEDDGGDIGMKIV